MSWKIRASLWFATLGHTAPYADPCEHPHKTVATTRDDIFIDRKIAPLVEALWAAGVETYSSCQGERSLRRMATAVMPNLVGDAYRATITIDTHDIFPLILALGEVSTRHGAEPAEVTIPSLASEIAYVLFDPLLLSKDGIEDEIIEALERLRAAEKKAVAAAKRRASRKRKAKG